MTLAIETQGFAKYYGNVHAVEAVNLQVHRGEIYGFLGLNGAGKTTTIRALLGMIRPSQGSIRVLGEIVGLHGRGPWRRVGHLVETPVAYPELTVHENLEIARRLHGIRDTLVTSRVITLLNLDMYTHRRAGTLSLGNLQRLGLARALLHHPELLILDEPTNGLDPAGMVEIRSLLERLAHEEGVTIFMSSHILTEVERIATRIGIIHRGKLIEELDREQLARYRAHYVSIHARDLAAAEYILTHAGYRPTHKESSLILSDQHAIESPDEVARLLVQGGMPPTRLAVEQESLEEHFMHVAGASL